MSIFKAIQTQHYRDKINKLSIGEPNLNIQLTTAQLGFGWLKKVDGIDVPDLSVIPVDQPITSVPAHFKTVTPVLGYANGKLTVYIESNDFPAGTSHQYNTIAIMDGDGEAAYLLVGQPSYISAERPLSVNASFEQQLVTVE
ncbi:hypothetical protein [Pseudoalteromonas ruthenica]|uniref:hypothetical protein n=1 Tax=Pseudoalteromonas ruthenica TaxID=151081 RepID=UPI00110AB5FD|nr:hypothetical protein [Pseudoalteromonas ruthenica]TMO87697.1 hypothetical protein CWC12_10490 [Pseudoalteromonas ruthenica]TMP21502.1 hypothetical protein CWC06_18315 [Pseudoalteromonas ruthenica]